MELKSFLRGWLTLTAVITIGHCYQALDYKVLAQKLYEPNGRREVTQMYSRLFSQWNLFFALLRLTCVVFFESKPLYIVTLGSFVATIAYFLAEIAIYRTTGFNNMGVAATLTTSTISLILMCLCWTRLWNPEDYEEKISTSALPMELAALSKKTRSKTRRLKAE